MRPAYLHRRRKGVSEIEAAVLTIAITLIAGAALFGWVNDEAASNEQQYGQAVAGSVNFLNERFSVVDMAYPPSSNSITIWVYNDGQIALQISQVTISNTNGSCGCEMTLVYPGFTTSTATETASNNNFCVESGVTDPIETSDLPPTEPSLPGVSIAPGSNPVGITLVLPAGCELSTGSTYSVNVLGLYGNDATYYSEYSGGS